jgi:transposase-like protein
VSREERAKILATAEKRGWTAAEVEKRYGISRWTFYGWRKRTGPGRSRRETTLRGGAVKGDVLRAELRAALPGILREEIARAFGMLFQISAPRRRGRRAKR